MRSKSALFKRFLILLNFGVIILYLISCLLPFINTGESWFLALPGLIFPFIFFFLFFFLFFWIFLKSKWWLISLIVLLLGFQQIFTVFAFNFPRNFSAGKEPHTIRVLQWNVTGWDDDKAGEGGSNFRVPMLDLVKKQDADVLCFEEFFEPKDTGFNKSNVSSIIKMGFTHHYFVPTVGYNNDLQSGISIFSRYPIIDTAHYSFRNDDSGEHLLYADIKVNDKLFRILATHLQPLYLNETDYQILNWFKPQQKNDINDGDNILSKLKRGYRHRYWEAEFIRGKIDQSPYPVIICGDFNDLPNSSVYFKIKGNLQDAFLKKGSGFGRTTPFISPTLRIDYIFADKSFKVTQFQVIHFPYSDNHYPIKTDLQFQND